MSPDSLGTNWILSILPELILTFGGIALILLDAIAPKLRGTFAAIAVIVFVVAANAEFSVPPGTYFAGTWQPSELTLLFDLMFLLAGLLATLFSRDYMQREGIDSGEFYALLMWGTVGMMLMSKGLDLIVVVLGLEILSVCIFVLVGYHRRIAIANEASLKYFLMGAFATGFVLYGIALLYGGAGSTKVADIARYLSSDASANPIAAIAFVMLIAGLGFKLALAPFHGWAPDVYQGAPTPVAAWLSVAPKAATLIALMRILVEVAPVAAQREWMNILAILAILSMVIGNFVATAQRDLKRLLAYSGIAQVGYMTIALFAIRHEDAIAAISIYALTYVLMNIGAFGVVSLLAKNQNDPQTLNDIAGLGFRRPLLGLSLAVFMFSLAGIPPTAGFISKFYVFKVAVEAGEVGIALIGILTSIVSVYYYLRVVYFLYMKEADETTAPISGGIFSFSAIGISVVGIFLIGLFPTPLFRTAAEAARVLLAR